MNAKSFFYICSEELWNERIVLLQKQVRGTFKDLVGFIESECGHLDSVTVDRSLFFFANIAVIENMSKMANNRIELM